MALENSDTNLPVPSDDSSDSETDVPNDSDLVHGLEEEVVTKPIIPDEQQKFMEDMVTFTKELNAFDVPELGTNTPVKKHFVVLDTKKLKMVVTKSVYIINLCPIKSHCDATAIAKRLNDKYYS